MQCTYFQSDKMALAEPRRRTKWTLNPRGNIWANDTNKFGQKLMEKMGWEQGKGLGANQDGRIAPVTLRHKDDAKGIGFQGHDDTWLAHQDDFQAVLAALNSEHGTATESGENTEVKGSLEETSKSSKKRVHYQKFTRGKDLKNYSADDLGCILGTKSEKRKSKKREKEGAKATEVAETEVGKEEKSHGLVTIQGGNYQDYFKKKMADLRARGKSTYTPPVSDLIQDEGEEEEDAEPKMVGFKTESEIENMEELNTLQPEKKKKKKKSKSKDKEEETTGEPEKKKKRKNLEEEVIVEEKKSKKKKKKDSKESDQTDELNEENDEKETEKTKKKKNKKGKKEKTDEVNEEKETDSGCEEEEMKQKKKKKGKKEKLEKDSNEKKRKAEDTPENMAEMKKKKSVESKNENASKVDPNLGSTRSNLLAMAGYGI
ncbi:PIN2/TERF1-interacting telomerase inhibitor 1-like [Eurytemora carolleeae]|uniref:PIN2/TERF1-interacting telomerase inhibitor 1-like n=1 Tax=Eurytemora carolleeae TaxID=1294199 RepID=UPI000C78A96F|nr:PIN2/TERF1-interacting telomerase inhibitor 1-like [Eurytemora carolleeae]|eukprot:XP_023348470.1 PIN2/TERF1-interacting telomerase inhibitor 1-like [Eurytemora affinis]